MGYQQQALQVLRQWRQQYNNWTQEFSNAQAVNPAQYREYDERGLPVEWVKNYQQQTHGPQGEVMPEGALGWTPLGAPDWGGGLGGIWNHMRHVWRGEEWQEKEPAVWPWEHEPTIAMMDEAERLRQEGDIGGFLKTGFNAFAGYTFNTLADSWATGEDIPVVGAVYRGLGTMITGAVDAFNLISKEYERGKTTGLMAADEIIRIAQSRGYEDENNLAWYEAYRSGTLGLQQAGIKATAIATRAIREGYATAEEYADLVERYKDAAHMGYSAFLEPALREEAVRRVENGEDPRLVAMDLEIPGVELWGSLTDDPTIVLGYINTVRKGNAARRASRAIYGTAQSQELVDILARTASAEADDLVAREMMNASDAAQRMYNATRDQIVDMAKKQGLFVQTAGGKTTYYSQRMGNFIMSVYGAFPNDPDAIGNIFKGLVMAADPEDAAVRLEGIARLNASGLTSDHIFSQAANETAVFMRNLLVTAEGDISAQKILDAIADAGNDTAKLTQNLYKLQADAMEGIFPTFQERLVQNEEYLRLLDESADEAAEYLMRHPTADKAINPVQRVVAQAYEASQKLFYRPTANVQGALYMSSNPVYRVKNRWGNTAPIFVDQGFKPAAKSMMSKVGPFGISPSGSIDEIGKWGGGAIPEGTMRGIGPIGSAQGVKAWGVSAGAATDEMAASAYVIENSLRNHMTHALRDGVAYDLSRLSFLDPEQARLLDNLIYQNYGDVDAAIAALRAGEFPVGRELSFLSKKQIKLLQDHNLYNAGRQVTREAADRAAALNGWDEILDAYRQVGALTSNEATLIDMMGENAPFYIELSRGLEQYLPETVSDAFTRKINAIEFAKQEMSFSVGQIEDLAITRTQQYYGRLAEATGKGWQAGVDQGMQHIRAMFEPFENVVRSQTDDVFRDARQFVNSTWANSDWAKGKSAAERVAKWLELGIPGTPPEGCTLRQFRDGLWDTFYRPEQEQRFIDLRDFVMNEGRLRADALSDTAGLTADEVARLLTPAEAAEINSRMFDNAVMRRGQMVVDIPADRLEDAVIANYDAILQKSLEQRAEPLTADMLSTHLKRWRTEGLSAEEVLRFVDDDVKAALRTIGNEEEVLDFLLKAGEAGPAPGTVRIYQARPKGFDPAGVYSTSWAETPSHAGLVFEEGKYDVFWKDVPEEAWIEAQARAVSEGAGQAPDLGLVEGRFAPEFGEGARPISDIPRADKTFRMPVISPMDIGTPSAARAQHETADGVARLIDEVKAGLEQNWERLASVDITPEGERMLREFAEEARGRIAQIRAEGFGVASAARDFALHNYGDRYGIDLVLGLVYPYQFWHSRTYLKWIKRIIDNPYILSAYAHYREYLETQHAGLEPWWKHQINTNELLGLDAEHPLWFNLETTLNPLYGITGVDFKDSRKRLDKWGEFVDGLNKFGPSTWTPFQLAIALHYYQQGEKEAGDRWVGRLWQPSRMIRDVTALMGAEEGKGIEIDPFTRYITGGLGPYEIPRVGRMLGAMVGEGVYSDAEITDASYNQEGPIWDEAVARSINQRAPNLWQIAAPFFLGTGFKPRTDADIEIDRFYGEMFGLYRMKPDLSEEEYREGWALLREKYPFMDTLLMSRRSGFERDEALAWNVLNRIAPGLSDDMAERVGLSGELLDQFYETKGDVLSQMPKADYMDFMAGILKLGALLEVPDNATRGAWEDARSSYREMLNIGEASFGQNIWAMVDAYYASEDKDSFLRSNPMVEQALNWRSGFIMMNPELAPYYTSVEKIEQYYKGLLYDEAEKRYGKDLWDHFEVHSRLSDIDETAARQYWREHPQLGQYMEFRDANLEQIAQLVNEVGSLIPEAMPMQYREEQKPTEELKLQDKEAWIQAQTASYLAGGEGAPVTPSGMSLEQLRQMLRPEEYNLVLDYLFYNQPVPQALQERLEAMGILQPEAAPPPPTGGAVPGGLGGGFATRGGIAATVERVLAEPGPMEKPKSILDKIGDAIRRGAGRFVDLIQEGVFTVQMKRKLQKQLAEEFPGYDTDVWDLVWNIDVADLPEDIGGSVRDTERFLDFIYVESKVKLAPESAENRMTILHEFGHILDTRTGGTFNYISGSPAFEAAAEEVFRMSGREFRNTSWEQVALDVKNFPDMFGNPPANGWWGGPQELFAVIFSNSQGYLDNIPPPLRPFFDNFMEYAPTVEEYYEEAERP